MKIINIKILTFFTVTVALAASAWILATAPQPVLEEERESVQVVSVLKVTPETFAPTHVAYGRVNVKHRATMTAQVSGQIEYLAPNFNDGGLLEANTLVYRIDDQEYQLVAEQKRAELVIAKANLKLEHGQQKVAADEYQQLKQQVDPARLSGEKGLLLRKPQLARMQALVTIAQQALALAERDLSRTRLRLDRDLYVREKLVFQGDYVNKGDIIGHLYSRQNLRLEIEAPFSLVRQLKTGQAVTVKAAGRPEPVNATITEIAPRLKPETQLQTLYLEINREDGHRFVVGELVEAQLATGAVEDTLRLPIAVLDGSYIWIVDENNRLDKRKVRIIWQNEATAVIENVLAPHETIVSHGMADPKQGSPVQTVEGVF